MSSTAQIAPAPTTARGADLFILLNGVLWRPWLVVLITVAGTVLAVLVALLMPPVYQSTARILVESQQISDALARSTITASAAERLALIEQRLMTHANLLEMSNRLERFDEVTGLSPTDKVRLLRDRTRIESISFNANPRYRGPTLVSAFMITYESNNPSLAAHVANEFADMVLAQNVAVRTSRARETHEFFRAELERLGGELDATETDIAAHKSQNKDFLPGTLKLRLTEMTALRQQVISRAQRIARMEDVPDTVEIAPNVRTLQTAFNPLTSGQLELLRTKQRLTQERIEALQFAIDRTTQVEMELAVMQRKRELLQLQHKDALRKVTEAATGQKLEYNRQAERFEIIESARVPEAPIAPRRIFIAIGGALASLCIAVAIAGLLEWLSGALRTASDCQRLLNVRPILTVPHLPSRREAMRARHRKIAFGIGVVSAIGIAVWLAPLDIPGRILMQMGVADRLDDIGAVLLASVAD